MPRSGYRSSLLLVCLALLEIVPAAQITSDQKSATVPATTDQSSAEPNSTFHAESRLVVVDVVVTKHRDPVPGLTEPDFKVFEDGKPQEIAFFEAHIPPAVNSKRTPGSINIVLFDLLNTPLLDQPYAREQMIQFLKTLPPGQQVALFQLGTTLRMIAGFSATSDELIAAARKVVPHTSELLDTQESRERAQDELAAARDGSPNQEFFDRMQDFMAEATDTRDQDRAKITLQALNDIARAASGFRGRKNIIWLSEEFPVYFGPQFNASDPDPNARNYFEVMRDMGTMLSSAQVSLYPIDVRGLISGLVTASSGGAARGNERIIAIETLHTQMDNLAEQTGGRAFYDTNDLKLAMQRSLENGSTYYTIAYVPRQQNWDSKYHHIKVQLARSALDAEYRKGYFAVPQKDLPADSARSDFVRALQPATPASNMLGLKATISLPDSGHSKVRIDFTVDGSALAFSPADGNHENARLQFEIVAWGPDLKVKANASHIVELSLLPKKYQQIVHNGLAAHQELALPPGTYNLRVGVLDEGSRKLGTLDIPLRIESAKTSQATQSVSAAN